MYAVPDISALDLRKKKKKEKLDSCREKKNISVIFRRLLNCAAFKWYIEEFYISFNVTTWWAINSSTASSALADSVTECSHNCYGNGECVAGSCHCFPGFIGPYCSRGNYPAFPYYYSAHLEHDCKIFFFFFRTGVAWPQPKRKKKQRKCKFICMILQVLTLQKNTASQTFLNQWNVSVLCFAGLKFTANV